jgi:hypothetical protein
VKTEMLVERLGLAEAVERRQFLKRRETVDNRGDASGRA